MGVGESRGGKGSYGACPEGKEPIREVVGRKQTRRLKKYEGRLREMQTGRNGKERRHIKLVIVSESVSKCSWMLRLKKVDRNCSKEAASNPK